MNPLPINGEDLSVAVVIITCERPDYLKQSLLSVKKQSRPPQQIIVVDDCSETDYSCVIGETDKQKVNYLRLPHKSGANAARNLGVQQANTDLVAFLDDDDIWHEDFLKAHIQAYVEDKVLGATVCGHRILEAPNEININPVDFVDEASLRLGNQFSGMSGVSAKRDVLLAHPFDESLTNGQDWDLFVRLVCANVRFKNIKQPLFLYRRGTPDGITSKAKKARIEDAEKRLGSAFKHRSWLGEEYFKKRVSEQLLSFLPHKQKKLKWLVKSLRMAGFKATFNALAAKL